MEIMIEKEKFETPKAEVVLFDTCDVITISLPWQPLGDSEF